MMKSAVILICLLFPLNLQAQKVNLLTVNQLEQRINAGKDTVYVINFWATWCAPCIEELPYFEQFAKSMKQKPVKVLLISLDFKSKLETTVQPFVNKLNLRSDIFLLNEKSQQTYIERIDTRWSGAIPATLIINPKRQSRHLIEKELTYPELLNLYKRNISNE